MDVIIGQGGWASGLESPQQVEETGEGEAVSKQTLSSSPYILGGDPLDFSLVLPSYNFAFVEFFTRRLVFLLSCIFS
jgi:hypothetical protein